MNRSSLCVVLILSALLGWLMQAQCERQLDRCRSNTKDIAYALEMYAGDYHGRYPPNLAAMVSSGHLQSIPTCPSVGFDNYSAGYHATANPDGYSFGCVGRHHGEPSQAKTRKAWWDRVHCSQRGFPWKDTEVQACCMGEYEGE